jgi:tRNA pseudouridine55 synthase
MPTGRDIPPALLDRHALLSAESLADGACLLLDKPTGPSSFAMVALLRRLCGVRKVGHAGTLDPFASGLLLLLTGPATRWQDHMMGQDKRYRATLRLGCESDSHDRTGVATSTSGGPLPGREDVEAALSAFRGEGLQVPPMHSAIQIGGKRLYQLARKGITVERTPRPVVAHALELVDWAPPLVELELHCGKGYYVRSLARDLGRVLGCGAWVEDLRRTAIGDHLVENAWRPEELRERLRPQGSGTEVTRED